MKNNNTLAVVIGVCFCFVVAGVVAIVFAVPEGANIGSLVTIMFAGLGTTIAAVAALTKVEKVKDKMDDLSNGLMDAKIRAGVSEVLKDQFLDQSPESLRQNEVDRARRQRSE